MNMRYAILDLGTNTFNLLIAEVKPNRTFDVLVKEEEFVKLAEDGMDKIGERAFLRAIEQLKKYKTIIDQFKADKVVGFGTAAIRRSSNGEQFIKEAKEACPMELKKISGDEEAELIYLGVRQAVHLQQRPSLIMDIGGGSVEFIVANEEKIFWKESFPIGGAVLRHLFHHHDPMRAEEVVHMINHIQQLLAPMIEHIKPYGINQLIGASGSFDTIAQLVAENIQHRILKPNELCTPISLRDFHMVYERIIRSTLEERLQLKGMVWFRAEMIVVATVLAEYVIEKCNIIKVTRSAYALKEGVLWGMMEGKVSA